MSKEAILTELRKRMIETTNNAKNGEYIEGVASKLDKIMDEKDPQKFAAGISALLTEHDNSLVGEMACKAVMERGNGHDVACQIGKTLMNKEMSNPGIEPKNFLRNDHALNGFTKEYLNQSSPEYRKEVVRRGKEALQKVDPQKLKLESGRWDTQSTAMGVQLTKDFVKAVGEAPLDPAAQKYLSGIQQVMMDPKHGDNLKAANERARQRTKEELEKNPSLKIIDTPDVTQENLKNNFLVNATVLRMGSDALVVGVKGESNATGDLATLITDATNGAQRVATFFDRDKIDTKPNRNEPLVQGAFTEEGRGLVKSQVTAIEETDGIEEDPVSVDDLAEVQKGWKEDTELQDKIKQEGPKHDQSRKEFIQQKNEAQKKGVTAPKSEAPKTGVTTPKTGVSSPKVESNGTQTQTQTPAKRSVRDVLKGALETVKRKLGVDDESKIKRLDKQIDKRKDHIEDLRSRRDELRKELNKPENQEKMKQQPLDYSKMLKGTQDQRDVQDLHLMKREADSLDGRVLNNREKLHGLQEQKAGLEVKVLLKQQQSKHHAVGV